MLYAASALGWLFVTDAPNAQAALAAAKSAASSASLLRSDVSAVHPATQDEIDWYTGMGGAL